VGAFTSTKLGTPSAPNDWPAYAAMCADAEAYAVHFRCTKLRWEAADAPSATMETAGSP
jgi:hypothetical protein